MSINQLDQITQYINAVQSRLNYSNELWNKNFPFEALQSLKNVIRMLRATMNKEDEIQQLQKWLHEINEVDDVKINNVNREVSSTVTYEKKTSISKKTYERIELEIWAKLGELGFYEKSKGSGITLDELRNKEMMVEE